MVSKRMIELKLTAPPRGVANVRVRVGESFPVAARVFADNIDSCAVSLRFDDLVLEEITNSPNSRAFPGPFVQEEVQWELRGKTAAAESFVRIDARGGGLFQLSEFAVEVTQ